MIFINILMIFGVKEKSIILTHTMYCYKYTCANYDCFVCVFQGHIFKMLIYSCDYSIITDFWSLHYSSLQCHMILQKSFQYADLELKKYFWLLSVLKTVVLHNILWKPWYFEMEIIINVSTITVYQFYTSLLNKSKTKKKVYWPQILLNRFTNYITVLVHVDKAVWSKNKYRTI